MWTTPLRAVARRKYRAFVEKGADQGRRPELVGGGLIRSAGGWKQAKKVLKSMGRVKGDGGQATILGRALIDCEEVWHWRVLVVVVSHKMCLRQTGLSEAVDFFLIQCQREGV